MSFEIHQEPHVQGSAEQQLLLQIEHLKRTVKSPYELIEHVIQLYGAEFVKANDRIAALDKSLQESGRLLQEQKLANDELFRIKQRVVIANRELRQTNNELSHVLRRFVDELPAKRDWLDPDLEKVARLLLKGHHTLPPVTDALRQAQARCYEHTGDGTGFARDLAALCDFLEQYDQATAKHAQPVRPDGDGDTKPAA